MSWVPVPKAYSEEAVRQGKQRTLDELISMGIVGTLKYRADLLVSMLQHDGLTDDALLSPLLRHLRQLKRGVCHPPGGATLWSTSVGPQVLGSYWYTVVPFFETSVAASGTPSLSTFLGVRRW